MAARSRSTAPAWWPASWRRLISSRWRCPRGAGDQLFLATDGFLDESIPDATILELVRRWQSAPLDEAVAGLVSELRSLRPVRACTDDATAVLIRLTA